MRLVANERTIEAENVRRANDDKTVTLVAQRNNASRIVLDLRRDFNSNSNFLRGRDPEPPKADNSLSTLINSK